MLGDITAADELYIITGYTDMRKSIDGLCAIVEDQLHMDQRKKALYLFCGKRCDRVKALLWEGLSADFCYPYISLFYSVTYGMSEKSMRIKIYDVSSF